MDPGPEAAPRDGVSLVVPNWNGRDLLLANVPSLLAAARAFPGEAEVLIVDDGSTDDSVAVLERDLKDARVVRHEVNKGFGPACNTGVAAARFRWVFLLNSDVRIDDPGILEPLVSVLRKDPNVFAVTPLVIDSTGRVTKISVNLPRIRHGELRWDGVPQEDLLALAKLPRERKIEIPTLFPIGCALLFDRARFLEMGGFDPLFRPFYHEDVDLGLAAWIRGWRCLVEPRCRVIHAWGGTINKHFRKFKVRLASRRHRILLSWKRAEGPWLRKHLLYVLRRLATRWIRFDVLYYTAFVQALWRLGEARRARAREERAR